MTTPLDQISAGLSKRQRPTPTKPARAVRFEAIDESDGDLMPARQLIELADLTRMATEANAIHGHFSQYVMQANTVTAEKARKILEAAARDGVSRTVTDAWSQNVIDELRRKDAIETSDSRLATYGRLRDLRAKADSTADFYSSPVQIVQRHMLGSEERGRMTAQIASAGPQALNDFAALAASQGAKAMIMAAAILARVDSLDKSAKEGLRFSRQGLASAVAGQALARAQWAIATTRNREQNAALLNRLYGQADGRGDFAKVQIEHAVHVANEEKILRAAGISIEE